MASSNIASVDSDTILAQFNRLIGELLRGSMNRNTFRPWEVELLVDIQNSPLGMANRRELLRRYQRAVQRNMERGAPFPMKLSEYLAAAKLKRAGTA